MSSIFNDPYTIFMEKFGGNNFEKKDKKEKASSQVARGLAAMLAAGTPVATVTHVEASSSAFPYSDATYQEMGRSFIDAINLIKDIEKRTADLRPGEALPSDMWEDIGFMLNRYIRKYPAHDGSKITPDDLKRKDSIAYKIPWDPISQLQQEVEKEAATLKPVVLKSLNDTLDEIRKYPLPSMKINHPTEPQKESE